MAEQITYRRGLAALCVFLIVYIVYIGHKVGVSSEENYIQRMELLELKQKLEDFTKASSHHGTLTEQSACASRGETKLRALKAGSDSTVTMLLVAFHYNSALNRCLIKTQITSQYPSGEAMWTITVEDAFDGKQFGSQITQRDHFKDSPSTNRIMGCRVAMAYSGSSISGDSDLKEEDCIENPSKFEEGVYKLMEGAEAIDWYGKRVKK